MSGYHMLNKRKKQEMKRKRTPEIPAKRVDIVRLKMVRERSLLYAKRRITSSNDAYCLLNDCLDDPDREQFLVVCLDIKNQPTSITTAMIGNLNSGIVHPREVFKTAVLSNAASVIVSHNHPSGDPTPSREDILVTKRLMEAGEVMGIELLDHIIIGDENYVSVRNRDWS